MKEFNITGVCIPYMHYMVDIKGKIEEVKKLVEQGKYFAINRARQYGKTTVINQLYHTLKNEYLYFLLQTPEYRMRARGFATGTTVLALPHDAILELPFIVAEKRLLNQFNELEPIHIGNKF